MTRIDFFDDPAAPQPTTRIPGASALVRDERERVLLIRRTDNGLWALPGGMIELGETAAGAAVRETREETGVDIVITGLVGIYTDPGHVSVLDSGTVIAEFALCFHARPVGGEARADGVETSEVAWVEVSDLERLDLMPTQRARLADALGPGPGPRIA